MLPVSRGSRAASPLSRGWRRSHNWAGNLEWSLPASRPKSITDLQTAVAAHDRVVVRGSGHSFVRLADLPPSSSSSVLSLRDLPRNFTLDRTRKTVTCDGGATLFEVSAFLQGTGMALKNTPSLPHFTVTGAVATATHGSSGVDSSGRCVLGSQASQVRSLTLVTPDGDLETLDRDGAESEEFNGVVVSLGLLGPVASVELDVVPEFEVLQAVYGRMGAPRRPEWSTETLIDAFPELLRSVDSFSVMVDWITDSGGMVVCRHFSEYDDRTFKPPPDLFGAVALETADLPPLLGQEEPMKSTHWANSADILFWFQQDGRIFGPQPPDEYQLEYFVPLEEAQTALRVVRSVAQNWGPATGASSAAPLLLYSELRAMAADDLWLSQNTASDGRDTLALAFGMNKYAGEAVVLAAAADMEAALEQAGLDPRPHWGKMRSWTSDQVRSMYGDAAERFSEMCHRKDPAGKFGSEAARDLLLR